MSSEWLEIPVLKVSQPIGDFLIGAVSASKLVGICRTDVRRLEIPDERDTSSPDLFRYVGIQRPLNKDRVYEIEQYVRTVDACFPNTIIIAVASDDVRADPERNTLSIRNRPDVATVIDGQHRLAGFYGDGVDFDLIVTIFTDMEIQEQAYLFSTINSEQTKINPSLQRDLLEFSTIETPEKIAHNIAKLSNMDASGPWYHQIKMLGIKDEISKGIITQHAFVTELLDLIYPSADYQNQVRSTLKEKRNDRDKLRSISVDPVRYPFWQFYLDSKDERIKQVLDNYFNAAKEVWPQDWANPERILSKTTGYQALMHHLRKLIVAGLSSGSLKKEDFVEILGAARTRIGDRPLTIGEWGVGRAAANELEHAMFGES